MVHAIALWLHLGVRGGTRLHGKVAASGFNRCATGSPASSAPLPLDPAIQPTRIMLPSWKKNAGLFWTVCFGIVSRSSIFCGRIHSADQTILLDIQHRAPHSIPYTAHNHLTTTTIFDHSALSQNLNKFEPPSLNLSRGKAHERKNLHLAKSKLVIWVTCNHSHLYNLSEWSLQQIHRTQQLDTTSLRILDWPL